MNSTARILRLMPHALVARLSRPDRRFVLAVILVLVALFLSTGISQGEFHLNVDEAFHATTGLFCADFLRDRPLRHPIGYTYHYYAQYPALGIVHWPPLFHMAEGAMFLLFGASVTVARVTVALFALLGLYFWYQLVREIDGDWAAAASTLLLGSQPALLLYEKAVMLEVPSLALCIAAVYYWVRYSKYVASSDVYWCGFFAGLALLTKQQSLYILPLFFLMVGASRQWHLLLRRATIVALAICAGISAPYYLLALGIDTKSIGANVRQGVETVAHPFYYYPKLLPAQLGVPLLLLSILGLVTWPWWRKTKCSVIMVAWIIGWYIMYTALGTKTPRYIVYWLPPFIYFLVAPLTSNSLPRLVRPVASVILIGLLATTGWAAWRYRRPYISGYEEISKQIVRDPRSRIVLFDGELAGNFIFFMRADDPARQFIVLRKALYVNEVMAQFGHEELIHSQAELNQLLKDYGIRYIVIEKGTPLYFTSQQILRDALNTGHFRLLEELPIQTNIPEWTGRSLQLYENLSAAAPTEHVLRLKMLSMNHDIAEPLDSYLRQP